MGGGCGGAGGQAGGPRAGFGADRCQTGTHGLSYDFDDAIHAAISARELNPSLFMMLRTWLSTV